MTRSDQERFSDILRAIERCQAYEAYLHSEDLAAMAYDAVLRPPRMKGRLGARPRDTVIVTALDPEEPPLVVAMRH